MSQDPPLKEPTEVEPPPFTKTWGGLYALVLFQLAFWIAVFYWFTRQFEA